MLKKKHHKFSLDIKILFTMLISGYNFLSSLCTNITLVNVITVSTKK